MLLIFSIFFSIFENDRNNQYHKRKHAKNTDFNLYVACTLTA